MEYQEYTAFEERAAIMEFCGNMPRQHAEIKASIDCKKVSLAKERELKEKQLQMEFEVLNANS